MANLSWADPFSAGNTSAGESFEGGKDPYKIAPEPVSGNSLTQRLRSLMNFGGQSAADLNAGGTSNVGAATDYWGKILSGNRAAMMEGLAPEVKSIQGQYANVAKANTMLAPRGGGRAAVAAEAPYSMASAIQSLLQSMRPQAAGAMSQIGLAKLGLSNQELAAVLQASLGMRGQDLQESENNAKTWAGLGSGIAKLVPWGKIFPDAGAAGGGAKSSGVAKLGTYAGGAAGAGLSAAAMAPGAAALTPAVTSALSFPTATLTGIGAGTTAGAGVGAGTGAVAGGTGAAAGAGGAGGGGALSGILSGLAGVASWAAPSALFAKAFIHPKGFNRDEVRTPGSQVQEAGSGVGYRYDDPNALYWLEGQKLTPEQFKQKMGVYPWELQLPDLGPGSVVDPNLYNTVKGLLGPGNWTPEEVRATYDALNGG